MAAPNSISQAVKALEDARTKGAHTVRITANLLEALLGSHTILSAAFSEIDRKEAEGA